MTDNNDQAFCTARGDTFARLIALIDARIAHIPVSLLIQADDISMDQMRHSAARESWSLIRNGVNHLYCGAPGGKPGMMTEALARTSLRSSGIAAALGVKPPHFEQMYFTVDYTTGQEAAVFLCRRLVDAASGDLQKSKRMIQNKIREGLPKDPLTFEHNAAEEEMLKKQVGFAFNMLADIYAGTCRDFGALLETLSPPAAKPPQGPKL